MTARVLVVDDLQPNLKLLEAKLTSEYFDVLTAQSGKEALEVLRERLPDIILLDVMMPGMDGYEVCRRIKADPDTTHIPVVMVTALGEMSDRVKGLEAGADDFLTKPVNDLALFARVRSLVRLKMTLDQWRMREQTCDTFGMLEEQEKPLLIENAEEAQILLVDCNESTIRKIRDMLTVDRNSVVVVGNSREAIARGTEGGFDLIIVGTTPEDDDALRLCSQLRSHEETRQVPILLVVDEGCTQHLAKGLELGVNDYLVKPIDRNEMLARTRTQVRRKRYQDRLQSNYQRSLEMALTDSLTGVYNRRYLAAHLGTMIRRSSEEGRAIAVLMLDIDHFKRINDTHGHAVGDKVLCEIAERLKRNLRSFDVIARVGGEEFVVVMPDVSHGAVEAVSERLRRKVGDEPFAIPDGPEPFTVTISVGGAISRGNDETPESMLKRADETLYQAKREGRDRVVLAFVDDKPSAAKAAAAAHGA